MMNELNARESLSANAIELYQTLIVEKCLIRTECAALTTVQDSTNFTRRSDDGINDTITVVGNKEMCIKTERLNI